MGRWAGGLPAEGGELGPADCRGGMGGVRPGAAYGRALAGPAAGPVRRSAWCAAALFARFGGGRAGPRRSRAGFVLLSPCFVLPLLQGDRRRLGLRGTQSGPTCVMRRVTRGCQRRDAAGAGCHDSFRVIHGVRQVTRTAPRADGACLGPQRRATRCSGWSVGAARRRSDGSHSSEDAAPAGSTGAPRHTSRPSGARVLIAPPARPPPTAGPPHR